MRRYVVAQVILCASGVVTILFVEPVFLWPVVGAFSTSLLMIAVLERFYR